MTAAAVDVTRLTRRQLAGIGPVLARAFFDDPFMVFGLPDERKRRRVLPWLFERTTRYVYRYGEVYTTGDTVEGAALWLPPGDVLTGPVRMLLVGMWQFPVRIGLADTRRFFSAASHLEELHKQVPSDHWYLAVLGVDPPRQGQGVGGSLIQPILSRADADGLPCYLETEKAINVTFYRKHGFEVVVEGDIPKGGPHFWTMRREPKR